MIPLLLLASLPAGGPVTLEAVTLQRHTSPSHPGLSAGGLGDVDGDGVPDLFYASLEGELYLQLASGATGLPIGGPTQVFNYQGVSGAPAGEVNADGTPDVILGGPQGSSAAVVSGLDGQILFELSGGRSSIFGMGVAGAGDRDGDGRADFAVGDPWATAGSGVVYVHSGATGTPTHAFSAPGSHAFGHALVAVGDRDGDGVEELLIGATFTDPPGKDRTGAAYLLSGASGLVLLEMPGEIDRGYFGASVANAGDVDGDGIGDFLIGGTQELEFPMFDPTGYAEVRSGADGSVLWHGAGEEPGDVFGYAVCGLGDLDGDGTPDFAVGAPGEAFLLPSSSPRPGKVHVHSGTTGKELVRLEGNPIHESGFGHALGALGDVDGDGRSELVIGAPGSGTAGTGRVHVVSFRPVERKTIKGWKAVQ